MLQQRNAENNSILIYVQEFRIENKNTLNGKKKNKWLRKYYAKSMDRRTKTRESYDGLKSSN